MYEIFKNNARLIKEKIKIFILNYIIHIYHFKQANEENFNYKSNN